MEASAGSLMLGLERYGDSEDGVKDYWRLCGHAGRSDIDVSDRSVVFGVCRRDDLCRLPAHCLANRNALTHGRQCVCQPENRPGANREH